MFRYLRALWYFVTGRFTKAADALQSNQYVMGATYDRSIGKQEQRFNTVKEAVASLMAIKIQHSQRVQMLTEEINKLTKIKAGAGVMAKKRADLLKSQGKTDQEILSDPEVIKHQGAFQDASTTLAARQDEIKTIEAQANERAKQVATYQAELQQMQRNIQKLRSEKHEAIADTQIAEQMDAVNSVLAGITRDTTDKDLQAARDARDRAKAKAQISADLTGGDAKLAESEYLAYADRVSQDSEFTSLLGLDQGKKEEVKPVAEPMQPAQLPPA